MNPTIYFSKWPRRMAASFYCNIGRRQILGNQSCAHLHLSDAAESRKNSVYICEIVSVK